MWWLHLLVDVRAKTTTRGTQAQAFCFGWATRQIKLSSGTGLASTLLSFNLADTLELLAVYRKQRSSEAVTSENVVLYLQDHSYNRALETGSDTICTGRWI